MFKKAYLLRGTYVRFFICLGALTHLIMHLISQNLIASYIVTLSYVAVKELAH